jgi:hypothetical protein
MLESDGVEEKEIDPILLVSDFSWFQWSTAAVSVDDVTRFTIDMLHHHAKAYVTEISSSKSTNPAVHLIRDFRDIL